MLLSTTWILGLYWDFLNRSTLAWMLDNDHYQHSITHFYNMILNVHSSVTVEGAAAWKDSSAQAALMFLCLCLFPYLFFWRTSLFFQSCISVQGADSGKPTRGRKLWMTEGKIKLNLFTFPILKSKLKSKTVLIKREWLMAWGGQ